MAVHHRRKRRLVTGFGVKALSKSKSLKEAGALAFCSARASTAATRPVMTHALDSSHPYHVRRRTGGGILLLIVLPHHDKGLELTHFAGSPDFLFSRLTAVSQNYHSFSHN